MSGNATRGDIDEVVGILRDFMDQVDNRFTTLEDGFASLDNRVTTFESRVNVRFDELDKKVRPFNQHD